MDEHERERATASRRQVLKGAGAVAGGLAAIGALGHASGALGATPAGAAGFEAAPTYPGGLGIALGLKLNGHEVAGDNPFEPAAGSIECTYFQHEITAGVNTRTGVASGKRQHAPIIIRKPIDRATPLLFKGLIEGQSVDASFRFFRVSQGTGELEQYYTVEIEQGRIGAVKELSPDNLALGAEGGGRPLEEVSFTYQRITWTWRPTETVVTDSWNAKS